MKDFSQPLLLQISPCYNTASCIIQALKLGGRGRLNLGFFSQTLSFPPDYLMGSARHAEQIPVFGQYSSSLWRWKMTQEVPTIGSINISRPTIIFYILVFKTKKHYFKESLDRQLCCHGRSHVPQNFMIIKSCLIKYIIGHCISINGFILGGTDKRS